MPQIELVESWGGHEAVKASSNRHESGDTPAYAYTGIMHWLMAATTHARARALRWKLQKAASSTCTLGSCGRRSEVGPGVELAEASEARSASRKSAVAQTTVPTGAIASKIPAEPAGQVGGVGGGRKRGVEEVGDPGRMQGWRLGRSDGTGVSSGWHWSQQRVALESTAGGTGASSGWHWSQQRVALEPAAGDTGVNSGWHWSQQRVALEPAAGRTDGDTGGAEAEGGEGCVGRGGQVLPKTRDQPHR